MHTFWSSFIQPPEDLFLTRRWRFPPEHAARWRAVLRLPDRGVIAEVGCGPGGLLSRIAQTTSQPRRILGIDRDAALLAFARRELDILGLGDVELVQGEAAALPLPDHCFDALTSYTLIEHLPDPAAFGRECRRVVRPGGTISVASTGRRMQVERRLPTPPGDVAAEIDQLEAILHPWLDALYEAYHVGRHTSTGDIPALVRSWGLADFRVESWTQTLAWDDHRLTPDQREELVRGCCEVSRNLPPAETALRKILAQADVAAPERPYLTPAQRKRLRRLYDRRAQLALEEARQPGSGPFYVNSVMLVASGVVG